MASFYTISEQVIRLLEGGPKPIDSRLDKRVISAELRQILHRLVSGYISQARKEGELSIPTHYVATFSDLTVVNDTNYKRNYVLLPDRRMSLYDHRDLYEVRPFTGDRAKDKPMIPVRPSDEYLYESLTAGKEVLKHQWCFFPDRDRVWFSEKNNKTLIEDGITMVSIKMVSVDPTSVADNDTLPIPPELEMDMIRECLALHGMKVEKDLITDQNPDIR